MTVKTDKGLIVKLERDEYTIPEIAKMKGASKQSVHQLIKRKGIRTRDVGPVKLVRREDVEVILKTKQHQERDDAAHTAGR